MSSNQKVDFVWIEENVIGASSYPDEIMFAQYQKLGIKVIFNLTKQSHQSQWIKDFICHHIPVKDFSLPTITQVMEFLQLSNKYKSENIPMVVHCIAGCGRTGQFLAIWGIENGKIQKGKDPITWVRSKRSCAVETTEQINFVKNWYETKK